MPERRGRAPLATAIGAAAVLLAGGARAQAPAPGAASAAASRLSAAIRASAARPGSPAPPGATLSFAPLRQLDGGGGVAPLCRSQCAAAFYQCGSGGSGGDCATAAATCRRGCDASAPPAPGRLQSPLPSAGLAPVGALRALPGALPSPPQ